MRRDVVREQPVQVGGCREPDVRMCQMSCRVSLHTTTVTSTCSSKERAYKTKLYGSTTAAATCEQAHNVKLGWVARLHQERQVHQDPLEIVSLRADGLRLEHHTRTVETIEDAIARNVRGRDTWI